MRASALRTVLAGICGGFAMNIAMLLTFRFIGFGWKGKAFPFRVYRLEVNSKLNRII
jgi:hypothetical protein